MFDLVHYFATILHRTKRRITVSFLFQERANIENDNRRQHREDIDFPDNQSMFESNVARNSELFKWANNFYTAAKAAGISCSSPWKNVELVTEFSGSGCAEASVHSACAQLGVQPTHRFAADVDPHCREVLLKSRQGLDGA